MRRFILVPALVLFALVGGAILFVADQAYAGCCMCGTCRAFCTCPGKGTCPYCSAQDLGITQATNARGADTLSVRGIAEPLSPIVAQPVSSDRLRRLGEGQCARNTFRLKLLEQTGTMPMFESAALRGKNYEDSVVAFQAVTDRE